MEITIRQAKFTDTKSLRAFEQGVVQAELPFNSTLNKEGVEYYDIDQLIMSPESEILVAVSNNQLIGSGYARIEKAKPYFKHSHHGYLGFMYVLPEFRRQGVNKMIFDALKNWCKSKGVFELRLDVYSQNAGAIRAYEKVGFEPLMIEMRMKLDD